MNFLIFLTSAKSGDTAYVEYTYGRKYIPEKRYNVPQRTTIGKVSSDDETMMSPNPNFMKYFPEIELPEETVTFFLILQHTLSFRRIMRGSIIRTMPTIIRCSPAI